MATLLTVSDQHADASEAEGDATMALIIIIGGILTIAFVLYKFMKPASPKPNVPPPKAPEKKKDDLKSKKGLPEVASGLPMTILFGSQSGTAETYAYELGKEARNHNFNAKVVDLEVYDHEEELANEKFVVFLVATFGEGEPTDSAVKFNTWLTDTSRAQDQLNSVPFAVFGLGNRQYEHFCEMGRRVSKHMKAMGATEIVPAGEGDDDGSLEDDYAGWKEKFWSAAAARFGNVVSDESKVKEPAKFQGSYSIEYVGAPAAGQENGSSADGDYVMIEDSSHDGAKAKGKVRQPAMHVDPKHGGHFALVVENRELRQDANSGSTRHLEIDIRTLDVTYRTADNLGVYPRNDYKTVAKLIKRLGYQPDTVFNMRHKTTDSDRKLPFHPNCTVRDALLWYCDITDMPKRSLLEILASYATDPADKAKLLRYVHEDKAQYQEDQKTLYEVLDEVPSVKPPLEDFLEFVPKLTPRFYTISSSSRRHPDHIHITVAVTRMDKPRGRVHYGVCSAYLASLEAHAEKVPIFVRTSSFRLPWEPALHLGSPAIRAVGSPAVTTPKMALPAPATAVSHAPTGAAAAAPTEIKQQDTHRTPLIMVGPGTGVAPFRGFLQEAQYLTEHGIKLGEIILFFGCQRPDKDYIYHEEFEAHSKREIVKLLKAFSRLKAEKVYVQHLLQQEAEHVWRLLDQEKAFFYVCGGTTMGRDVKNTLLDIAKKVGKLNESKAKEFLDQLVKEGRYVQELWS